MSNTAGFLENILSDIRVELAEEFDKNFQRKAFFGVPWTPRKVEKRGTGSLLLYTGRMRRSIRARVIKNGVEFSSDTPYAGVHNEGLQSGRGKGFTMPRRQFIGDGPETRKIIKRNVERNVAQQLKAIATHSCDLLSKSYFCSLRHSRSGSPARPAI